MLFSACIAASVAGFFFWYRDGHKVARATCYIASACAVLAKGPAGIALRALVICAFLAAEEQFRLLWKFWSWPLAGLVLLIDVGWYALAYYIGGNEFLGLQIFEENVDRYVVPMNFLLCSLILRVRGEREDSDGRFLHTWWISIFGFFCLLPVHALCISFPYIQP